MSLGHQQSQPGPKTWSAPREPGNAGSDVSGMWEGREQVNDLPAAMPFLSELLPEVLPTLGWVFPHPLTQST